MVYYFESKHPSLPTFTLYMGKDKFENENLIQYGFDCDVWFHVDNMSSAHVYARLPDEYTWEDIPDEVLEDAAQLTKANSISGNKRENVKIIYTPWSNLHKDGSMDTGQVSFKKEKVVKKVHVRGRKNEIVNRLNKTKKELEPDFRQEKINYDKVVRRKAAEQQRLRKEEELQKVRDEAEAERKRWVGDLYDDEHPYESPPFQTDESDGSFM